MILKEILSYLLLIGCIQIHAKNSKEHYKEFHEGVEVLDSPISFPEQSHFQGKEVLNKEKFENEEINTRDEYLKRNKYDKNELDKKVNMKINEIDSNTYIDKYNKYGKTFNTKKFNEKEHKLGSLFYDTNVNYIKNNQKISDDSELINKNVNIYKEKEKYQENYQNKNEIYHNREKKDFYQNLKKINLTDPPSPNNTVLMARYIVHTVDWAAVGTLSSRVSTKGSPFVCVKATTDGRENTSSGIPYFYMSPRDLCTQDILKDNRASVLVTLSETDYCKNNEFDPQDPRCGKLTLLGKIKKVKPGSSEEKFAKDALFAKHPAMAKWPIDHDWFITKLKIGQIILLDQFGGAIYIKVKDYLNGHEADPNIYNNKENYTKK